MTNRVKTSTLKYHDILRLSRLLSNSLTHPNNKCVFSSCNNIYVSYSINKVDTHRAVYKLFYKLEDNEFVKRNKSCDLGCIRPDHQIKRTYSKPLIIEEKKEEKEVNFTISFN